MIYSIARATPAKGLERVEGEDLNKIAESVRKIGIKAEVYY